MPELKIPLIRGTRQDDYDYRSNLPVNMTAVLRNIKGAAGYLLSHDGLTEFSEVSGVARGATYNERFNKHFRVSGDVFEYIEPDGTVNVIGNTPGISTCSFANSFNTQAVLSDGKVYYYDNANLIQFVDQDLGVPIDVTWFRGIYVFTDGSFLYHTDINNEFSISPLKYSSSEFAADRIVGVARNDQNQIIAFNRYSIEYFYFNPNAPVGTSVLQVISGKASKVGIVGTHCKTELDGTHFILGGRKEEAISVHALNAGQPVNISTREIDKVIATYSEQELTTVVMEARVVDRDKFIIIHLPNETLIYNHTVASAMGKDVAWSYVKSGIDTDEPWRGIHGIYDPQASKWIYGDKLENKLGYLDQQTASQYGEQVECVLYTPIVDLEGQSIDVFEIDTIPGFTTNDFSSAFSTTYNHITYGEEYWNIISAPNEYELRYRMRRLGYVRDSFSMKFRFVSVDKMAFSGLTIGYS